MMPTGGIPGPPVQGSVYGGLYERFYTEGLGGGGGGGG